jgi:transposase
MDAKDRRIKELERENSELQATIKKLELLVVELRARVDELERQVALNSSNSSKPPSSDGLRKKSKNRSLREINNKKFGGQVGHSGDTLKQIDNPDITIEYDIGQCSACGGSLVDMPVTEVIERQEIDIVVKKVVTAYKASVKVCSCGKKNTAAMPEHMKAPVQYGANIRAMSVYLTNQFIAKARISNIYRDLFHLSISDTTLVSFDNECAEKLAPFYDAVLEVIKNAAVKHMDETGMRVANKTQWTHVISTELLTHYRIDPKRGNLLTGLVGKIIHDHWKPYLTIDDVLHAFCNAHHLRELKALIDVDDEKWAQDMYTLLKDASHLENPSSEQQLEISDKYDQIVAAGLKYHNGLGQFKPNSRKKRPGHNLLIRLRNFKTETLRFLYDPSVPFTNNLAERDLRMMKLKQKVSGCFRTEQGARTFAIIRSFVSTVQKQSKNIFQYLSDLFNNQFDLQSVLDPI